MTEDKKTLKLSFNAFGSSDSQDGFGNDNEIIVNTNWDVLKGKIELDKVADKWYEDNKEKLRAVDEITMTGHSFGGLKLCAYLAAIARDKYYGQTILDKITNIALFHPLPSSEATSIKEPNASWFIGKIEWMFQSYQRPSIIDYIEDIKKVNCKLPNATVEHKYAQFDDIVKNDPKYPEQVAYAFINSSNKSIVKKYSCFRYKCGHCDIPRPHYPHHTHKDLLENAMKKKSMEYYLLNTSNIMINNNNICESSIEKPQPSVMRNLSSLNKKNYFTNKETAQIPYDTVVKIKHLAFKK